ncbi:AAA domain-containing protein [Catenulispora yoronensis]
MTDQPGTTIQQLLTAARLEPAPTRRDDPDPGSGSDSGSDSAPDLDPGSAPDPDPAPDPARLIGGWADLQLDADQRAAVELALGSDVLFLWGPPGTGKTDVVSYIVEGCYRQDRTVLFLAPTAVAVDQALHRICRLLGAETGFDEGLVQRSGPIASPGWPRPTATGSGPKRSSSGSRSRFAKKQNGSPSSPPTSRPR